MAAESETNLDRAATVVAEKVTAALPGNASMLGPAPMFRARNRFRRRFLIKSVTREETITAVYETVEAMLADKVFKDIVLSIDVDPQ